MSDNQYPELPKHLHTAGYLSTSPALYTADQMREYVDADRAMRTNTPKEAKVVLQVWRSTDFCEEFWSWDECDQYDYDRAKPEDRRIICIVSENV